MSKYKDMNKIYRKKMKAIRGVRDVIELTKGISDDVDKTLAEIRLFVDFIKSLMAEKTSEQSAIYLGQAVRPNIHDVYSREEVLIGVKSQITHREFITYVNGDGKNDYYVKKYNESRSQCIYLEELLVKLWRKGAYYGYVESNHHFLHSHDICVIKNILSARFLSNAFESAEENMYRLHKKLKSIDALICDKMAYDRIRGEHFASKKEEKLAKNSARIAIRNQEFVEFLHRNKQDSTVMKYTHYVDKYNACRREIAYIKRCQENLHHLNHDIRFNMAERYGLEWHELIHQYMPNTTHENAYAISVESRLLVENESVEHIYEEIRIRHDINNSESLALVEQSPPSILNTDIEGAVGGVSGWVDYDNLSNPGVLHFRRSGGLVEPSLNLHLASAQPDNGLGASLDHYCENTWDLKQELSQDLDLMRFDDKSLPEGPNDIQPIRPGEPAISLYAGWRMESSAAKAGDLMWFDDEPIISPDQHHENIEQLQQKITSISLAEPANTLRSVNVTPPPATGIAYN